MKVLDQKNNESPKNDTKNEEYSVFAKNSFYSFLVKTLEVLPLISNFFIARLVSADVWGFLLIAISTITIISIISHFLPPALDYSLNYYIPRYISLNQKTRLRSFIKNSIYLKLLFLLPIFIISILVFSFLSDLFKISLEDNLNLLFLLSPLILIISLNLTLNAIHRAFNKFRFVFFLLLIRNLFKIIPLLLIFLFFSNVDIVVIAIVELFSYLIPFILNCCYVVITFFSIKKTSETKLSLKENTSNIFKYGSSISFKLFAITYWREIQIQGIGLLDIPENVTGFNLSFRYSEFSNNLIKALNFPLMISFTRFDTSQEEDKISTLYKLINRYFLFLLLLISGILYFLGDFYIFVIYGVEYLEFSLILKLSIISVIFGLLAAPINSFLFAKKKVKYVTPIQLFVFIINLACFFIGLVFYGLLGAVIGNIISSILIFIFYILLNLKLIKIRLNLRKILLQYVIFFISLLLTMLFEVLFLEKFNYFILHRLNLLIFKHLHWLSIITFLITFFLLQGLLRIFTLKDIEYLEAYLKEKESKVSKLIQKSLRILKKINILK